MSQPLLLQVPKQHDFSNPAVELNPKRVDAWLRELPLLNLSQSAKALLDALAPANLQPMPAKTRIRLLELYRQTFVSIYDGLDEQALRTQPIGSAQRAMAREHGNALCRELAIGYKILVRELYGQDPQREPLLQLALYRAMESIVLTLLDSYRCYQTPPTFAYLELHHLHVLSEQAGVLKQPVRLEKQVVSDTGIDVLYRRILMLSVADPFHLPAGTAAQLYRLLAQFAEYAEIRPYQESGPAGCYLVDRGSDGPPVPIARAQSDYGFDDPVLLDLRAAVQRAGQQLQEHFADGQGEDETARLLAILAPQMQQQRQRQASRRETRREAWISFGIESVHYYVTRGAGFIADEISDSQAGIQVRNLDSDEDQAFCLESWRILNESVSGYLLSSTRPWQGDARIGDVVAIVTATREPRAPRLSIAIVRWMRAGRNRSMEMGVELIPGNVRAVQCETAASSHRALSFSNVPALRLPPSLVTAAGTLRADESVQIRLGNRTTTVRIVSPMKETDYIAQFEFANTDHT